MNLNHQTTQTIFSAYEYERGLGQPNPVWEPVSEHFYPLACKQVVYYLIFVFGTIGGVLGIFIGFLFWATSDLQKYVLTWTIVFCILLVISLFFFYLGGKDRRRQEKQLIAQTNRKQQQMMRSKR